MAFTSQLFLRPPTSKLQFRRSPISPMHNGYQIPMNSPEFQGAFHTPAQHFTPFRTITLSLIFFPPLPCCFSRASPSDFLCFFSLLLQGRCRWSLNRLPFYSWSQSDCIELSCSPLLSAVRLTLTRLNSSHARFPRCIKCFRFYLVYPLLLFLSLF